MSDAGDAAAAEEEEASATSDDVPDADAPAGAAAAVVAGGDDDPMAAICAAASCAAASSSLALSMACWRAQTHRRLTMVVGGQSNDRKVCYRRHEFKGGGALGMVFGQLVAQRVLCQRHCLVGGGGRLGLSRREEEALSPRVEPSISRPPEARRTAELVERTFEVGVEVVAGQPWDQRALQRAKVRALLLLLQQLQLRLAPTRLHHFAAVGLVLVGHDEREALELIDRDADEAVVLRREMLR